MAKKSGPKDPLAAYWAQVVNELSRQLAITGAMSYKKVVNNLFSTSANTKTYEKCIERFVERIEICRNAGAVSEFPIRLRKCNDRYQWRLSEEDLGRAASLKADGVLKSIDGASDAGRMSDLLRVARATIVVGVRWPDPHRARDQIERWDFKSYATLVEKLHSHHAAIEVEPFDVGANSPFFLEDLLGRSLNDSQLVIFVGSARSNRLSNVALSKMLGRDVESACTTLGSVNPRDHLPFHFCWNTPDEPGYYPSQMELPIDQLRDPSVKKAVLDGRAYAFEFHGKEELVNHMALSSTDYGVVLAQRRGAQTWILALGASGPATEKCCEMIFRNELLGLLVPETDQGVLCQPISCDVKRMVSPGVPYHLADNRSLSNPKIYGEALVIPPNCRQ